MKVGETALFKASEHDRAECVSILLAAGANHSIKNNVSIVIIYLYISNKQSFLNKSVYFRK